ncbi:hypothetical protein KI387_010020, partial [Taxus chinensis]
MQGKKMEMESGGPTPKQMKLLEDVIKASFKELHNNMVTMMKDNIDPSKSHHKEEQPNK